MKRAPMTSTGAERLRKEVEKLKSVDRPRIIAAIAEARTHGDLSENAEYHAAKERQGWIEGRIAVIEDQIARAQIIDVSKLSGEQVKFGATVSVVDEDTDEKARYQIVGEHDFRAFTPTETQHDSFVRVVEDARWYERGDAVELEITADSYLRHMVRTLVGTMLERDPDDFVELLDGAPRSHAGSPAPAHGLYLVRVGYG